MDTSALIQGNSKNDSEAKNSMYFVANISYPVIKLRMIQDNAAETLLKAKVLASKLAFNWKEIKEPKSGQCFLIYMSTKLENSPPDGVNWPDQEVATKHVLPDKKVLHVCERRNGIFINNTPGKMIKRRYFLENTAEMQIQLLHYLDEADDQKADVAPKVSSNQEARSYSSMSAESSKQYPSKPHNVPRATPDFSSTPNSYKHDSLVSHSVAVEEENHLPAPDTSKAGNKSSYKKKGGKHMANKIPPKEPINVIPNTNQAPVEPPIFGDELDLIALRDVALFRFRRNHENLADLFSPALTQKTIESSRKPLVPSNYSGILSARKEKNLLEIKALKEVKPYDKNITKLLYDQLNQLRKASSLEEVYSSRKQIEHEFGELIDRRKTYRPIAVSSLLPQELESSTDTQFFSL